VTRGSGFDTALEEIGARNPNVRFNENRRPPLLGEVENYPQPILRRRPSRWSGAVKRNWIGSSRFLSAATRTKIPCWLGEPGVASRHLSCGITAAGRIVEGAFPSSGPRKNNCGAPFCHPLIRVLDRIVFPGWKALIGPLGWLGKPRKGTIFFSDSDARPAGWEFPRSAPFTRWNQNC